jgi:hypothetical protein
MLAFAASWNCGVRLCEAGIVLGDHNPAMSSVNRVKVRSDGRYAPTALVVAAPCV